MSRVVAPPRFPRSHRKRGRVSPASRAAYGHLSPPDPNLHNPAKRHNLVPEPFRRGPKPGQLRNQVQPDPQPVPLSGQNNPSSLYEVHLPAETNRQMETTPGQAHQASEVAQDEHIAAHRRGGQIYLRVGLVYCWGEGSD